MKKIVLLGSTGLIGARVFLTLTESYEIIRLGRNAECEIIADLSKPETLSGLDFADCYAVVHCAGVTDEDFKSHTAEAFIQSSIGMESVIRAAEAHGVKKFVYISTSHVYGLQEGTVDERTPANPLSDYAIAHYVAEQTLRRNAESFENTYVLRPNAVFGEPVAIDKFDRWNLIPYSFPLEAVYSKKIVLRSSGDQNRNFVGTKDIARYIEMLLASSWHEPFSVINPLGKSDLSVYEFAVKCAEIYRKISGEICTVERPSKIKQSAEQTFKYKTRRDVLAEKDDLDDKLFRLTGRIVEELKNGKKYQA